jgi:hypothetical protein
MANLDVSVAETIYCSEYEFFMTFCRCCTAVRTTVTTGSRVERIPYIYAS